MLEPIKLSCENLLQECSTNIESKRPYPFESTGLSKNHKPVKPKLISQTSPKQQEENNFIIEKLRKKGKKVAKQPVIRKTQLGEDLKTFTKEQFQRLEMIDQYEARGIYFQEPADDKENQIQTESAVERLRKLGKIEDIIDQVKANLEWGDLKGFEKKNVELKTKEKTVAFVRHKSNNRQLTHSIRSSSQKQTLNGLDSKHSGSNFFSIFKSFARKFFVSSGTFIGTAQQLSLEQKIAQCKLQAEEKIKKNYSSKNHIYMTKAREQALYECQLLRNAKKTLGVKLYDKLQIHVGQPIKSDENQKNQIFLKDKKVETEEEKCEAEEVLQKNYNRIRAERKRVIEKLMC